MKLGLSYPSNRFDDEYLIRIIDPYELIQCPTDSLGPYRIVVKIHSNVATWHEEIENTRNRRFAVIVILRTETYAEIKDFIKKNIHNRPGVDTYFILSDNGFSYNQQLCKRFHPQLKWVRSIQGKCQTHIQAACCTASDLYINHYLEKEMKSIHEGDKEQIRWYRSQQTARAELQRLYIQHQFMSHSDENTQEHEHG